MVAYNNTKISKLIHISNLFNNLDSVVYCNLILEKHHAPVLKVNYIPIDGAKIVNGTTYYGFIKFRIVHDKPTYSLDGLGKQEQPKDLIDLAEKVSGYELTNKVKKHYQRLIEQRNDLNNKAIAIKNEYGF